MYENYGEQLKQQIIERHLVVKALKGCTEREIEQIRQSQGVDYIPEVYRQFLLAVGNSIGGVIYKGTDYNYRYLLRLKEWAEGIVSGLPNSPELPPDAFVFVMHQGYIFFFFRTFGRNDNPPVYSYFEGDAEFELLDQSLTEYYEALVTRKW